ncbi:H2-forming methylenetetrahydromethanopterin dehydrogenase [Methanothermus fervidus DSM 2088]|uniref:5,10-methenyltetrahydromethanopterin hydrogenase n=1 Tax=Methanothermus fervidus (strain ATCC 43054 / DSM 2088 / JCM 10308 / V24 S) TaxID=523846 RepID=E3GXW7_METFV|nr:H(2)-dependent methylenetetrahydromethanopterin dehydrogenase-related protein [Methanothermus fervidus]ADP77149.1 H2-forming methylenetetrahydromethanopterin dehydrogenase [Methanothermus fervidus DSM 2088]
MKIAIYGAGNQNLYTKILKLQERFGGEPPFGGSRMAIEFSEAGHDVVLAEKNREVMEEEHWKKVEDAGVEITDKDEEAAKDAEVAILFTPFGKRTYEIVKKIIKHLPEGSVIANTCTASPLVIYYTFEREFRERKDLGISSLHPAAVPGTPQHGHYVISGKTTFGLEIASEDQVGKCVELAKSCGKEVFLVPADVSSAVGDMGVLVTAVTLAGILEFYHAAAKITSSPQKMVENQIVLTLETIAALVSTKGIDGTLKLLKPNIIINCAKSMNYPGNTLLPQAFKILQKCENIKIENNNQEEVPYILMFQEFIRDVKKLIGKDATLSLMKYSFKNFW